MEKELSGATNLIKMFEESKGLDSREYSRLCYEFLLSLPEEIELKVSQAIQATREETEEKAIMLFGGWLKKNLGKNEMEEPVALILKWFIDSLTNKSENTRTDI